jgi:hypothetical protein
MPDDMSIPSSAVLVNRGGAMRCYKLASELIMLPLAALVSPHRTWHDQVDVVSYAAKFMGLSETGGRGGVGVI